MKKKKKNTKKRKKEKKRFSELSFEQLMEQADGFISSGKPRNAIKLYKMALKASKQDEESKTAVHTKIFKAYIAREKELRQKKMIAEADDIKKQAMQYQPEPSLMDHQTMISYIGLCDAQSAFNACAKYFEHNGIDVAVEMLLADKLVTDNCWSFLNAYDIFSNFKRDAGTIENAIPLMNDGEWHKAMDSMRGLPRTSPFAHIRMFCRAMASFCNGNDKDMFKAISLIPETSVFKKITDALESSVKCVAKHDYIVGDKTIIESLWNGPANLWKTADRLIHLADKKQYDNKMKSLISNFSNDIFPDATEYARQYILEILWQQDNLIEDDFIRMERELLKNNVKLLQTKRNIIFFNNPLENAAKYLKMLKNSDAQTLAITESIIILHVCRYILSTGEYSLLQRINNNTKKRFGISSKENFETIFLRFAGRGIKCDTENRDLYELVAKFECHSKTAKKIKEDLLLAMCDAYPDDPYPCIELASLYHGKNAFRKAENILKKAMELAPYDSRVMDQHVISLIISADKNINRNKFHLVWQDVEKAEQFDSKKNEILLKGKKLFYKICEKPEIPEKFIKLQLNEFTLFDRLKIISMIRMDVENKSRNAGKKILRKIDSLFKSELKNITKLSSSETLNLLLPFPREWKYVFRDLHINRLLFNASNAVLNNLNDTDLIKLVDLILTPDLYTLFQKEIKKRLNKSKTPDSLLKFYAITLQGLDNNDWDVDGYFDLLEDADTQTEKQLRDAAQKLSKHADGPYKHALQSFNFDILIDMFSSPFNFFDDDDEYDNDFDDAFNPPDIFNPFGGGLPDLDNLPNDFIKFINRELSKGTNSAAAKEFNAIFEDIRNFIEEFIDETGLRGLPKETLKTIKPGIKKDPIIGQAVTMMNLLFLKQAKKKLSQEAQTLFL